jgi:uroporphyrinogen-III synthase
MRLLLTRPTAEASDLDDFARRAGHSVMLAPMLAIETVAGLRVDLNGVQAVAVTSRNGVRALAGAAADRGVSLWCVGGGSAAEARGHGFANVTASDGGVERLADAMIAKLAPADGSVLHVCGDHVAGDLVSRLRAAGFSAERVVGYRSAAAEDLPPAAALALERNEIDAVVLMSTRTARTFVAIIERRGLVARLGRIDAVCISPAVAAAARALPWRSVHIADRTDLGGMTQVIETLGGVRVAS